MSIFALSDGSNARTATDGVFDSGGGSFENIPAGTALRVIITEAKFINKKDFATQEPLPTSISLRWDVIDGPYKGRVVFQDLKINDRDQKKADKQRTMAAAIDHNCNGNLPANPTDMDLMSAWSNKPMMIKVEIWEQGDKSGNWVSMVGKNIESSSQDQKQPAQNTTAADEIPF